MANLINQKFLLGIDSSKFKIAANGALMAVDSQGQLVEILKLNPQDQALVLGIPVASKTVLDQVIADLAVEVAARQAAISSLDSKIDSEISARQSADASNLQAAKTYADGKIQALVNGAPAVLDTLKEIADALGNDANLASTISGQIASVQSGLTAEVSRAQGAEAQALADAKSYTDGKIATEQSARSSGDDATLVSAKAYADGIVSVKANKSYVDSEILAEKTARESADSSMQSAINGEISRAQAAESALSSSISSESSRAQAAEAKALSDAKAYADGIVATEASSRSSGDTNTLNSAKAYTDAAVANVVSKSYVDSADTALSNRISPLESRSMFGNSFLYNDTISGATPGDQPGSEDPSTLKRDGWYFKNSSAGQGIAWYFYDKNTSQGGNIVKTAFSAFAVMTFDAVAALGAKPIIGIYSYPTGSGDAVPGFYHSKWVYQLSQTNLNSISAGKKVLLYIGSDPSIHPELQHIQLDYISGSSAGPRLDSEVIGFSGFIGDSTTSVNKIQWMVESLGVDSSAYKMKTQLRIRYAQKASVDAEIARAQAAESVLTTSVNNEISARSAADLLLMPLSGARAMTGDMAMGSHKITGLSNGSASSDAVNKGQLDAAVAGVVQKTYVDAQDDAKLVEAKAYADTKDAANLVTAKAYADSKVAEIVNSAPQVLDTLNELANALGNDPNFATTVSNQIGTVNNNLTAEISRAQAAEALKANKSYVDAADQELSNRINAIAMPVVKSFKRSLTQQDYDNGYVELPEVANSGSIQAFVDRLALFEGADEDYTVSTVSGKSRVTFKNAIAKNGEEELVVGYNVYFKYEIT